MMMERLEISSVFAFHGNESPLQMIGHVKAGETGLSFHGDESPLLMVEHVDVGETGPSFH